MCADSVFSAPFYIQNLLDNERSPNYQVNDPNGFLNSLMQVRRLCHVMFADIGLRLLPVNILENLVFARD